MNNPESFEDATLDEIRELLHILNTRRIDGLALKRLWNYVTGESRYHPGSWGSGAQWMINSLKE